MVPKELKYTKEHEWINTDGTVGVTDHAQHELGDVVFVELPKANKELAKGTELCVLESVKAVSSVYSPVSGKVISVNDSLSNNPELINQDPYGKGWLAIIEIKDQNELNSLMSAADYEKLTAK
jgi:glycine cleavage system H protein